MKYFFYGALFTVVTFTTTLYLSSGAFKGLYVEDAFIVNQSFAVPGTDGEGNSIYFGRIDGTEILQISSSRRLYSPFINQEGQMLFVEGTDDENAEFRLLSVQYAERKIDCKILLTSSDYLGSPFMPKGDFSGAVLFFTGHADPNNVAGTSVGVKFNMLFSGQVIVASEQEYLHFGRLAQIADSSFIGVAVFFETDALERLVNVDLKDGLGHVTDLTEKIDVIGDMFSVSSDSVNKKLYLSSNVFGQRVRKDYISVIDIPRMEVIRTVPLDEERSFSNVFPTFGKDNAQHLLLLSAPRFESEQQVILTISSLTVDGIIDENSFALSPNDNFKTEDCAF